jgi:hypothetical protein
MATDSSHPCPSCLSRNLETYSDQVGTVTKGVSNQGHMLTLRWGSHTWNEYVISKRLILCVSLFSVAVTTLQIG